MIKISIIIPVYGVEKYINKCLESLVNQSLDEIEIIVVNDGSKDNSQIIIDKFVKKYPNKVKSFIKENGGQGSARNYGLQFATGKYIGYVDSDDYVETDMFLKLYEKAEKENSDVVICNYYNVNENYEIIKGTEEQRPYADNKINALLSTKAVWNKIYRKDLILNETFRSKIWYEDFDFTTKVLVKADKIDYVDEYLYNYIIRSGSTMNNSNIKRNLEILNAFDCILNDNNTKKYQDVIEFLAIDHILISANVRIITAEADNNTKKECIDILTNYVKTNFPNYKTNKYLSTLSRNRKIIYFLINIKAYFIIKLIFRTRRAKNERLGRKIR